ncbi:hypothetical protein ACIBI9_55690 [Nonomuraea sp. NPDC050451]|uniref:hypothetical protein n=1 Tax=Nonomuraea sp. NPDC050451 TaxID=3364364 RepID=UPI0037B158BA
MTPPSLSRGELLRSVWGFNFVVMQAGLRHFPPLLYAGIRFALAAFPALPFAGRPGVPWRWVAGVAATIGVGQFGFLLVGMRAGMPARGLRCPLPGRSGCLGPRQRGSAQGRAARSVPLHGLGERLLRDPAPATTP